MFQSFPNFHEHKCCFLMPLLSAAILSIWFLRSNQQALQVSLIYAFFCSNRPSLKKSCFVIQSHSLCSYPACTGAWIINIVAFDQFYLLLRWFWGHVYNFYSAMEYPIFMHLILNQPEGVHVKPFLVSLQCLPLAIESNSRLWWWP